MNWIRTWAYTKAFLKVFGIGAIGLTTVMAILSFAVLIIAFLVFLGTLLFFYLFRFIEWLYV